MTSLRKTISILLAVIMVCSAFGVMPLTASANSGEQSCPLITDIITDTEDTNTYYFYMPEKWRNEYNDNSTNTEDACPCIYWWEGTDNCLEHLNEVTGEDWPGYRVTETVAPNVFVAHVPKDVSTIIWNNSVDGGDDVNSPQYLASVSTANIPSEYFDPNDPQDNYGFFPEGTDSFDGMIFVCDPDEIPVNDYSKKPTYNGSWFYYYGNGEYGIYPTKEEAEENDAVYSNGEFPVISGYNPDEEPGATEDEAKYDYSLNGTGTVTVEANSTNKYIKFVPEESATYRIFSQCHEDVEATLYDSDWDELDYDDDNGDSLNFMIKQDLEEGQTYYLKVNTVDFHGEGDYVDCDVVFGFESDYDDNDPATEDEAQEDDYKDYSYEVNGEGTVAVSTNRNYKYIKFVPDENQSYEIYSDSDDYDTYAVLLDENGEEIAADDDSADGDNFCIADFLKAGKTYYVGVRRYNGSDFVDYNVTFKKTPDTPAGWLYEGEIVTIGDFKYCLYFERYRADEGDYSKCYCAELIGYNGNEENVVIPESFEYDNRTVYVSSMGNYIFASNPNASKIKTLKAPDGISYISAYALFDSEGGKRLDINLECGEYTHLEDYYYETGEFGFDVNAKYATLNGYYGSSKDIVIPAMVEGVPVTIVEDFINNQHKANVKSVTIPDTVEWISGTAFRLESYNEDLDMYSTTKSDIRIIGGENAVFGSYRYLDKNGYAFYVYENSATFNGYFGELTKIVIPSNAEGIPVEDISEDVISNKVTSVTIPDSVKYIDYYAFYVSDEDDRYVPSKATITGGENAFIYNYRELNEDGIRFYIGRDGDATVVGYYGFNPTLNIPATYKGLPVTSIGSLESEYNTNFVKNVIVPSSVKYIYNDSFEIFSNLESVTLPCSLENTFFYVWNSAEKKYVKMENIIKSHTEVTDEAVAPTTTKTGLTKGSHCSVCGTVITPQQVVPKLTSLSLEKSSATVYVKGTTQINAKVANSSAKTTYTSSDTKVATVSSTGKVTAKKAGKATITVTNNGVSKKFTVDVKNPKLSKKTVTVKKNKTVKVKIIGKIKGVNNKYTNTKFAKITSKKSASTLTIKGLKKGNTTLKINVSGITLRLKVKVKAK